MTEEWLTTDKGMTSVHNDHAMGTWVGQPWVQYQAGPFACAMTMDKLTDSTTLPPPTG